MARGSAPATTAATNANELSGTNAGEASGIYGVLEPQLAAQAANPQGFNPATMAEMRTSNMEGAGGTQAAAVGSGALRAARTRNSGGAAASTAASSRSAGEELSRANLKTNLANEEEKQQQRSQALGEEGSLFGTTTGAANNALGEVAQNVNANTGQENESYDWASKILDPILAAASGSAGLNKL